MKTLFLTAPILGLTTLLYLSLSATALSLTNTDTNTNTSAQQLTAPLTAPLSTQDATETVAIQQVLNAFAIGLDQRRFDLFDHIFTPDVTVNLNIRGFPILHNLNDVAAYMGRLLQGYRTFHVQSTHYIRLDGPNNAYATTYNSATYLANGQAPVVKLGRYEDQLVKRDSGWLISNRVLFHVGAASSVLDLPGDNSSNATFF